jgi:ribosomal protein S18 acetylase RimI-like enzyme
VAREWHITKGLETISVMTWLPDNGMGRPSVCDATLVGGRWYLNRVNVHRDDRGQGIGSQLVQKLQEALRERWALEQDRPEAHRLEVTPGGYGSDPASLEKFYAACGFRTVKPIPELLMEWK